jgi:predicted Rossmann-fold nucleotide-binding protein
MATIASERPAALRRVCVFSGSSAGNDPLFAQIAAQLGELLAKRNITLVYGGGSVGLMGACSSHVQQAGGHIISVVLFALHVSELKWWNSI